MNLAAAVTTLASERGPAMTRAGESPGTPGDASRSRRFAVDAR